MENQKKCVCIGGSGFVGHHIVNALIDRGDDVTIIDNLSTGKIENNNPKAKFYLLDMTRDKLDHYFEGIDTIFLTAALPRVQPSIEDPVTYNKTNVEGILRVLVAAAKMKVRRVVYSASSSVYGDTNIFPTPETASANPMSPYGLQKYIGEMYCKLFSDLYGLDTCSLRYFNIFGTRMASTGAYRTVLSVFGEQYKQGLPLTITNDGNQRRDFTFVGDVVQANLLAGDYKEKLNGEVFNIGNGNNYSINEVADMFGGEKQYVGNRIEPFQTLANNTKARKILGWNPVGNLPNFVEQYKKELVNEA